VHCDDEVAVLKNGSTNRSRGIRAAAGCIPVTKSRHSNDKNNDIVVAVERGEEE